MIELNKRQAAELFLSALSILNAEEDSPQVAFAEAVAHPERATIFSLTECIAAELHGKPPAIIDAEGLRNLYGRREVNLALRMCGVAARERGIRVVWTTAAPDQPTGGLPVVSLSSELLARWYDI